MNEVIRQLMDRKSVRAFTEQEISREDKELILHSAMQAPTAGNQQMYTIIDVTSQELKDALVKTCDNQNFIAKGKICLCSATIYTYKPHISSCINKCAYRKMIGIVSSLRRIVGANIAF